MKRAIPLIASLILCPASRGAEPAPAPAPERWFGASRADLARMRQFAGLPLKMKARFIRVVGSPEGGARARRTVEFAVAAEGGEVFCSLRRGARGAELLEGMQRGTPLVLRGRVDPKRGVFAARSIAQGWGKAQLAGGD